MSTDTGCADSARCPKSGFGCIVDGSHGAFVTVPGAHALDYCDPELVAELLEAYVAGEPLASQTGRRSVVGHVSK
jgi:hypothetical protein